MVRPLEVRTGKPATAVDPIAWWRSWSEGVDGQAPGPVATDSVRGTAASSGAATARSIRPHNANMMQFFSIATAQTSGWRSARAVFSTRARPSPKLTKAKDF